LSKSLIKLKVTVKIENSGYIQSIYIVSILKIVNSKENWWGALDLVLFKKHEKVTGEPEAMLNFYWILDVCTDTGCMYKLRV